MDSIDLLTKMRDSICQVGIKEVARRSGLASSTVSRVVSGKIQPSLKVFQKLSFAVGFELQLVKSSNLGLAQPRLRIARDLIFKFQKEFRKMGVKHIAIFGSVARGDDRPTSDLDIFLDFGKSPKNSIKILKAEGRLHELFENQKIDVVSYLDSQKDARLLAEIKKDGILVF